MNEKHYSLKKKKKKKEFPTIKTEINFRNEVKPRNEKKNFFESNKLIKKLANKMQNSQIKILKF